MNHLRNLLQVFFIVCVMLALQGCGNQYEEKVAENYQMTAQRIVDLGKSLDNKQLRNALIAKNYADKLAYQQPDMADIADMLGRDATSFGTPYKALNTRLQAVNKNPESEQAFNASINELNDLWVASDPIIFNDSLLDIVNTLADLSDGKLPRVNIPKKQAGELTTPGNQLVGNPNYGEWKTDSSGSSFWEWYGQYMMLSTVANAVFGGGFGYNRGPINRDNWYGRQNYSYHQDYGRSSYGSASDRAGWKKSSESLSKKGIKTPPAKKYGSIAGQKRQSNYAANRGSSSKPSGFGSASKRASTYSSYSSSSRGTSSGSRGLKSGK